MMVVKVSKIAVWDVEGVLHRDSKAAEKAVREHILAQLAEEYSFTFTDVDSPFWIAQHWDIIETRTRAAMAGT